MFKRLGRGRFGEIGCPSGESCNRSICLFSHQPNASFNLTTIDLDPLILPEKRPSQLDADSGRPTKLQKAGSAAKPIAIPTPSSSQVS
jgi:hypothetical protein